MKKTVYRLLAIVLALTLLLGCAAQAEPAQAEDETDAPHAVTGTTYPCLRQLTPEEKDPVESEMTLYFVDGGDVPYVALSEYMPFLSGLLGDLGYGDIAYEITSDGGSDWSCFMASRPDNESQMFFYPDQDLIVFGNYNTFTQMVGAKILVSAMDMPEVDMISPMEFAESMAAMAQLDAREQAQMEEVLEAEGEAGDADEADGPADDAEAPAEDDGSDSPSLFALKQGMYLNRAGDLVSLNLADYMIDIVAADGECYIPFQTMNDLLLNDLYMQYVFDGERVLGFGYDCPLVDEMDASPKHDLSEDLAEFNFNELCLLLDCKYGLKPEHNIESFSAFFLNNMELFQNLSSTNAMRSSFAIANLCYTYLDDLHSGLIRGSYLFDRDKELEKTIGQMYFGPSMRKSARLDSVYSEARKAVYRAWVPGYEEVGDTAFITFDEFTADREDYYSPQIDRDNPRDTIDLIIYANRQIKREGSPIRNIVIDLSNNYGGNVTAAICVLSWFLGEADIALRDTFTGAETNATYLTDVNLDGEYNAADSVATGYKLYCLITNSSFSCGNLVPAACRSAGTVTLVGQPSGGGSCVVLPCTTAAGTIFQISGNKQVSIIRNGSFYNTDAGVEPDFRLDKPESFYDRPALVEYLHNLK